MPRPVLTIEEPYTPELPYIVAAAIESLIDEDSRVFEFGSGYSTVWFALMCDDVTTVEHDQQWAEEVERVLRDVRRWSKVNLIEVDEEGIGAAIDGYEDFDLVFVDCLDRQRVSAVEHAMSHVRPGGYLVLDDAQWPMLAAARNLLDGKEWHGTKIDTIHTRKNGMKKKHQTNIYRRRE